MSMRRSRHAAALATVLLFHISLQGQGSTGEINGTVADTSGAVIAGAAITLTHPATNTQRVVKTNSEGIYGLPALLPGEYTLKVEMAGFNAQVRNDIVLQVGQVARIDIALAVGNVSDVVEVKGGLPVLDTESTSVGTVIENQRILELPLNGRNYLHLAALTPGTSTNGQPSAVGVTRQGGTRSQFNLSVSGQRIFFNHYTLDGIENTDPSFNSYLFLPSLDALQEFKVETGIVPAEYGHNMAQINVTTRSGSNSLHGTAFEFLRNSVFDAKNFFDSGSKPIPPFKRNQFGFFLGGPVVIPKVINGRDKMFFAVNYEGLRERKALTLAATVIPSSWVAGDFSGVSGTIYDPSTRVLATNGLSVASVSPFPNNRIPTSRINSISQTYLQKFSPLANAGSPATLAANNYVNTEGRPTDYDQQNSRIDYVRSATSSFMFRYAHSGEKQYNPVNLPQLGTNTQSQVHQGMLSHTWVLGSNKVNDFRFGISRLENANQAGRAGKENVVADLGIKGLPTDNPLYWGTPNVNLGGGISNIGESSDVPFNTWDTIFQWTDNFSWSRGKHSLKFGADFNRTRYNVISGTVTRGRFSENGQYTNNGVASTTIPANNAADFLLGYFSGTEGQIGAPIANYRNIYAGLYFQDSWKVSSKLIINYGLRYENQTPWVDKHDAIVNIDFKWDNSAFPVFARSGNGDPFQGNPAYPLPSYIPYVRDGRYGRGAYGADNNNFAPRLGIAYSLNNKTVIRTGVGLFFVQDIASAAYEVTRNAPFTIRNAETANTLVPNLSWDRIFTLIGAPSFLLAYDYHAPTSYVPQWSFGVQRQITQDMSLEVNYIGSAGVHLRRLMVYNNAPPGPGNINARRPFPILNGGVQLTATGVHSSYHSLQVRLQQRLSHGFTTLTAFSYGKSIDNGSGVRQQGGDSQNPSNDYNLKAERGLSSFDFRKRLTTTLLYNLPIGRGKAFFGNAGRALDTLIGGWQASTIVTLQDGFPLTPTCGSGAVQNGGGSCYPDATGIRPALPRGEQDPKRFFNTAAFVNRIPGADFRFGTAGRNTIIGPGTIAVDFSAIKNFHITERHVVEFRTEFFNLPNHPIFGLPGASPGTVSYGVIGSTNVDSRQLQFGLKYSF